MKTLKNLLLSLFVIASIGSMAQAPNEIHMMNGTKKINQNTTYYFYDSGGEDLTEAQDPTGDNNWITWYQHGESFLLHLNNTSNNLGIKLTFNYLRINDDHLMIYEGDVEDPAKLIVDLTNNDYDKNEKFTNFTVMSHGNMTIRFTSNSQYRDQGWDAEIELATYAPQPPYAVMGICDSRIYLLPGSKAANGTTTIYYTTDGTLPTSSSSTSTPIIVTPPVTVKAVLYEGNTPSLVKETQFVSVIAAPGAPEIDIDDNNKVTIKANKPDGLNDTYYVRYTLDGGDPRYATEYEEAKDEATFVITEPNTTITAVVRGTTCPSVFSNIASMTVIYINVPTPEITINENNGNTSIACSLSSATIKYTIDGSDPTTASGITYNNTSLTLTPGTTIKAYAYVNNNSYKPSQVVSKTYVPQTGNGVYSGVVLLDDREDHSWAYYSMGDDDNNPVHSLNPADIKITYYGYGNKTMTTTDVADAPTTFNGNVAATDVAVGPNDPGNQFIYLKTLENANEDGSGNYPYTLIPNPFSVRPAITSGQAPATRNIYIQWGRGGNGGNTAAIGSFSYSYYDANENLVQSGTININSNTTGTATIPAKVGTTVSFTLTRSSGSNNRYVYFQANYDNNGGAEFYARTQLTSNTTQTYTSTAVQAPAAEKDYRGFYAWRVKRLSEGLTIKSKDGNTTYGLNSIIPAETEIEFVTNNQEGNEVEFEALWAKAYVVTTNTATGLHAGVSYERNFIVGATPSASVAVPVTYSSYYPDGTFRQNCSVNGFTCQANTKFEYMTISGGTFNVDGQYYLCFGRGLEGRAASVTGINGNIGTEADPKGLNYTIRLESGTLTNLGLIREQGASGNAEVYGRVQAKIILGCDYDRAKKANGLLYIKNRVFFSTLVFFRSDVNKDQEVMNLVIKSGTFQDSLWNSSWEYRRSIYCGSNFNSNTNDVNHYPGIRNVTIEGGEMGSLNGGRATSITGTATTTTQTDINKVSFNLRVRGGIFHGAVFGGASNTNSWGSKRLVFTGGKVYSWIAGGANGTETTSNTAITRGTSYIYVGGNTEVGGSNAVAVNGTAGGQVFGAGRGSTNQACSMDNSNVVIADNAQIKNNNNNTGNVYGGGNIGYITNTAKVCILGGLVEGNVYGGAFSNGYTIPTSNVSVQGGTVKGSVYGGSNEQGNVGEVTMNITGGEIKGSVFGGGLGQPTNATGDVTLTVGEANSTDTATIGGDVYGGSEMGKVNTNTDNNTTVTINQAKIAGNVFGGGFGSKTNPVAEADVNGNITVTINGGTMNNVFGCNNINGTPKGDVEVHFNGGKAVNVYGGGNFAHYLTTGKNPVVYLTGGEVTNNVYGGGSLAKVNKTVVNVTGGQAYNVFAGAEGNHKDSTLVLGNKTVNMQGGTVGNIYGGSFTCKDVARSFVNISGGHVQSHVFGSGYFGDMYGDCYVYIGKNAILNAPHNDENLDLLSKYGTQLDNLTQLWIENNVYAGANWGSYTGTFGAATIKKQGTDGGHSNIYIDGTGYDITSGKNSNYILIDGSVYGSGTSCDAGAEENNVIIRNYGYMDEVDEVNTILRMTRNLRSIQRVKDLVLDNSSINFVGQGNIASNDPTVEYGIYHITNIVRAANKSNLSLSKPLDQVLKLGSYTCTNVYTASDDDDYTPVAVTANREDKNGVVINEGGYIKVHFDVIEKDVNTGKDVLISSKYGELQGFFNMQEPNSDGINNEGYIFARPKYIAGQGNEGIYNNPATYDINEYDGGFVDFAINPTRNKFDIDGNNVDLPLPNNNPNPINTLDNEDNLQGVQMPYTNKTELPTAQGVNDNDYRFWRYKPITTPTSSREIMFVVKADEVADADAFLTTTGSVYLPPAMGNKAVYKITELHWGVDGKDCYAVNSAITEENGDQFIQADGAKFTDTEDENKDADDYYANPNSSFGFVMDFSNTNGSLVRAYEDSVYKGYDKMVLSNESFNGYFINHQMAQLNPGTTELPKLDFVLTYSNRLSQNEMWAEALAVIEEYDPADTTTPVQKIYLYLSVSTMTRIGQNVETSVYASTAYSGTAAEYNVLTKDSLYTYKASLTLPTFMLGNKGLYATFTPSSTDEANFNKKIENNVTVPIVSGVGLDEWYEVKGTKNMALRFYATDNGDNTNGWTHKGKGTSDPNNVAIWDFENIDNRDTTTDIIGAADGRTYTTINFELRYDPKALSEIQDLQMGQHYLGYVTLNLAVDNAQGANGEVNTFAVKVHVYVTGAARFYYLDGIAGKDGNNGMFPDKAKKTFFGVMNADGYTYEDPIFVVGGVTPTANSGLTWDANKFLNAVTVSEEEAENYTEEEIRQLSQVKVFRYPGGHYLSDGTKGDPATNIMYDGNIINVPAGTNFTMKNVCISGGSDLYNLATDDPKKSYNPNNTDMETNYPLISITGNEGEENKTIVTIENSSLVYNNNNTNLPGAIYNNNGTLKVDGINISNNSSKGFGTGVYQNGIMNLGKTQTITISDQIFLTDDHIMNVPEGLLYDESRIADVMVEISDGTKDVPANPTPDSVNVANSITRYSGRVIVHYDEQTPKAPSFSEYLPNNNQKVFGSIRKAAPAYESQKYALDNELTRSGREFKIANGADPDVLPYITSEMKQQYNPTYQDLIIANINANLPVELLYFTAECMGEATQLQWSTASETNNEYFTIERSSDAVNYEEVARIQGAGTTSQRNDYSFMVDNNSTAITYYRLRQTDIDGKYEIFAPIAIQCQNEKAATEISIYPVPANDQVNFFSSNSPMTRIEIFSIMGAKVAEESAEGNQATLNISHLATGVYAVKVFTEDGQVSNVRLIKK